MYQSTETIITNIKLEPFKSSRPRSIKWKVWWFGEKDGKRYKFSDSKIFVEISARWVAQISVDGTADNDEVARQIIKTLSTSSDPECYWSFIRKHFPFIKEKPISTSLNRDKREDNSAYLYIFNVSGRTLIPSNQEVVEGDEKLVSLPRNTYKKISISGGIHNLKPLHRRTPNVKLNAVKEETYYIVIGYKPERSFAFLIGVDSMVMKIISEDQAKPLFNEFIPIN